MSKSETNMITGAKKGIHSKKQQLKKNKQASMHRSLRVIPYPRTNLVHSRARRLLGRCARPIVGVVQVDGRLSSFEKTPVRGRIAPGRTAHVIVPNALGPAGIHDNVIRIVVGTGRQFTQVGAGHVNR